MNPKASLLQQRYGHARRTCVEQHSYCDRESPCEHCQVLKTDCEYLSDCGKEALRHKYLGQEDIDGTVPREVLDLFEPKQTESKTPKPKDHLPSMKLLLVSPLEPVSVHHWIPLHPFRGNRNAQHEALVQSWTTSS